ncbi:MAG: hypothetical protein JSW23_08225 [Planctomycetota bacterium]|nr:MAG: hypothetical protein JSW23_08225 [Planctomycetota bacterium]
MNKWFTRLIIILQIGGGFAGVVSIAPNFVSTDSTPLSFVLNTIFTGLFLFGIVAGLSLIEKPKLGLLLSQVYQAVQIPAIASSVLVYTLSSGLTACLLIQQGGDIGCNLNLGVQYRFMLFSGVPWGFGINIPPLIFFIILHKAQLQKTQSQS